MSKENIEQFFNFIQNNQQLQQQLGAVQNKESFNELAVRLGQENGYIFTAEEAKAFINQKSQKSELELSDTELAAVAGGRFHDNFTFCLTVSQCWGSVC